MIPLASPGRTIRLIMGLFVVLLISCKPPVRFTYSVRVQDQATGANLGNIQVLIAVPDKADLIKVTDTNGLAIFEIDSEYADRLGELTVDTQGYKKHTQSINLVEGSLPNVIQLTTGRTATATPLPTPNPTNTIVPPQTGRLQGVLIDTAGAPLAGVAIQVGDQAERYTDIQGGFVEPTVPIGDQEIVVLIQDQDPLRQHVRIEPGTIKVLIFYDSASRGLGLFSIATPADGDKLEVRQGQPHRATIEGRCDGLGRIFGTIEIWVLVKSHKDLRYWVQHPSALIQPNECVWRTSAQLGDTTHPPEDGEQWDIVAIVAGQDSKIGGIESTEDLNLLRPFINSVVITIETQITP